MSTPPPLNFADSLNDTANPISSGSAGAGDNVFTINQRPALPSWALWAGGAALAFLLWKEVR